MTISSSTAPDGFMAMPELGGVLWQVGDPDVTISNRHRYELSHAIETLVEGGQVVVECDRSRVDRADQPRRDTCDCWS